jgi:hypothetical protein
MGLMDSLQLLDGNTSLTIQIFILDLLGWMALSTLLITIHFSERVHRHPVFMNFLCTWVMFSSFRVFACVLCLAM